MARCLILLSALALAACSTTPPEKPEPIEQKVPAMSPPELGIKVICDNGYLVGLYIAASEGGMWKLSIDTDKACKDWI
jgi:hypothetical protein